MLKEKEEYNLFHHQGLTGAKEMEGISQYWYLDFVDAEDKLYELLDFVLLGSDDKYITELMIQTSDDHGETWGKEFYKKNSCQEEIMRNRSREESRAVPNFRTGQRRHVPKSASGLRRGGADRGQRLPDLDPGRPPRKSHFLVQRIC